MEFIKFQNQIMAILKDFKYPRNMLEYFFKGGLKGGGGAPWKNKRRKKKNNRHLL